MKKFIYLALLGLMFSCSDHEVTRSIDIADNVFGITFDKSHDWNTTVNSSVDVISNDSKTRILVVDSFSIKILNESTDSHITFDVPKDYDNLMVDFISENGEHFYKSFNLGDKVIKKENTTRALSQDYDIPDEKPILGGTVETFANQRGWLPGEEFYIYDYVTLDSKDYTDEFKTTFRSIIFNYFPNGRKYNNLPKIKKSGYYNESVYPITTGDEPIIVSPVYKNDGGFYEISEAELYYYYFKGDLNVEEIEALPKYRAIDLSEVYTNEDNDIINKSKSYVLAYWENNVGSYQFPKGYKIGFCYKSNTEYEKPKKQGELYGDGRLNYNINSWGNFASSKLGPTEPRMAWMSVNKHMFLCIESGTDTDFNDLIIEVEGGIEPFEIIPDEPEYNFYTFCYEDQRLGDYDMNDVVLKGRRIDATHVEWTLMACGAYDELYIRNINGEVINGDIEVHDLFERPKATFINTTEDDNAKFIVDVVEVNKNYSFLDASTQPYIWDATKHWEVKIARQGEDPHAIMIPYDFKWPLERIRINLAYLRFNEWGTNKVESTDWYKYPENDKVFIPYDKE